MSADDTITYSVILPVYNEADSLMPLYMRLRDVMTRLGGAYELIFVDDGSDEKTKDILRDMQARDFRVSVHAYQRRRGQTQALWKGFDMARGEIIISMDADLQDDPAYIPLFIAALAKGYDVVCGYRKKRKDILCKIILSKTGNLIQRLIWKTGLHDLACTFRAYKKGCIKAIDLSRRGYHRYIPYLLLRQGYNITEVEIEQKRRLYSTSKHGMNKIFDVISDFRRVHRQAPQQKELKRQNHVF